MVGTFTRWITIATCHKTQELEFSFPGNQDIAYCKDESDLKSRYFLYFSTWPSKPNKPHYLISMAWTVTNILRQFAFRKPCPDVMMILAWYIILPNLRGSIKIKLITDISKEKVNGRNRETHRRSIKILCGVCHCIISCASLRWGRRDIYNS